MYFFSQPIIFAKEVRQECPVINWTIVEWGCLGDHFGKQLAGWSIRLLFCVVVNLVSVQTFGHMLTHMVKILVIEDE